MYDLGRSKTWAVLVIQSGEARFTKLLTGMRGFYYGIVRHITFLSWFEQLIIDLSVEFHISRALEHRLARNLAHVSMIS